METNDGPMPAFALSLIESGEALAYLHLSGAAVNDSKTELTYETTIAEKTVTFRYEVLCTESGSNDRLGKLVVYQPAHDPQRLVVAFRAVRVDTDRVCGNKADVQSMLDTNFVSTSWLPGKRSRISYGIARHAGGIWGNDPGKGLRAFLQKSDAREVHFTGLSLAGGLAQAVALRCAFDASLGLRERVNVFSFGAVPWLNASGASDYASKLGERAMHLCTHSTVQAHRFADGDRPDWWEKIGAADEDEDGADGGRHDYTVIDPITSAFSREHALLCSTFAIEGRGAAKVREPDATGTDKDEEERAGVLSPLPQEEDVWAAGTRLRRRTHFPPSLVSRKSILDLMDNKLPPHHPLLNDYMRLHRGRAYKAAVRGLVRSAMESRHAFEYSSTPPPAAPAFPKIRRTSSKRTLADLETENATDATNCSETEQPAQQHGGMSKIASYGSLANSFKLDEISMF